jgi:hypothetical protein
MDASWAKVRGSGTAGAVLFEQCLCFGKRVYIVSWLCYLFTLGLLSQRHGAHWAWNAKVSEECARAGTTHPSLRAGRCMPGKATIVRCCAVRVICRVKRSAQAMKNSPLHSRWAVGRMRAAGIASAFMCCCHLLQSLLKMGVTDLTVDPEPAAAVSDAGVVEEEDKFDMLNKWLIDNGARFPWLYMKRYSENYRGVHIRTTVQVSCVCAGCLLV